MEDLRSKTITVIKCPDGRKVKEIVPMDHMPFHVILYKLHVEIIPMLSMDYSKKQSVIAMPFTAWRPGKSWESEKMR